MPIITQYMSGNTRIHLAHALHTRAGDLRGHLGRPLVWCIYRGKYVMHTVKNGTAIPCVKDIDRENRLSTRGKCEHVQTYMTYPSVEMTIQTQIYGLSL